MDKEKLSRYAYIKDEIKALEEKAEILNNEILDEMTKNNLEEISFDEGKISVTARKKWTYPTSIVEKETILKEEKKDAERVGTATYENTYSIRYTPAKSE